MAKLQEMFAEKKGGRFNKQLIRAMNTGYSRLRLRRDINREINTIQLLLLNISFLYSSQSTIIPKHKSMR